MTINSLLTIAVLSTALAVTALANEPPTAPPSDPPLSAEQAMADRVERLVQDLGAADYVTRQNAQAELNDLGLAAYDALFAALEHDDLEVRLRAQDLIDGLRGRWISSQDATDIQNLLSHYSDEEDVLRAVRIEKLGQLLDRRGVPALCRLVRFERSDLMAKQAALAVLNQDVPEDPIARNELRAMVRENVARSKRTASQWLLTWSALLDDLGDATDPFTRYIDQENELLNRSPDRTNHEVINSLRLVRARFVLAQESPESWKAERESLINQFVENPLVNEQRGLRILAEWFSKHELWDDIVALKDGFQTTFGMDRTLTYQVATAYHHKQDQTQAEATAKQAAELAASVIDDAGSIAFNHLTTAVTLQDAGMLAWAERESRMALAKAESSTELAMAGEQLAELLHDADRNREAAEALNDAIQRIRKAQEGRDERRNAQDYSQLESRMHYFYSRHFATENDRAQQTSHLVKGLAANSQDADVLIAVARIPEPSDQLARTAKTAIRKAVAEFQRDIQAGRQAYLGDLAEGSYVSAYQSGGDLATSNNQLAWLLGNAGWTKEQRQLALQCSQHSLELRPESPGYLDTLARCHYSLEQFDEAIHFQRQAVRLEPHLQQLRRQLELFESATK